MAQSTATVLFVEDDVFIRMPIAKYLRDCGYKVIEAVTVEEAMTVLGHVATAVDVVFGDIDMSTAVEAFGLAKWVREHRPGLQVLLAGSVPRAVERAKQLCEQGPVGKPYDPKMVENYIRRLLAARKV